MDQQSDASASTSEQAATDSLDITLQLEQLLELFPPDFQRLSQRRQLVRSLQGWRSLSERAHQHQLLIVQQQNRVKVLDNELRIAREEMDAMKNTISRRPGDNLDEINRLIAVNSNQREVIADANAKILTLEAQKRNAEKAKSSAKKEKLAVELERDTAMLQAANFHEMEADYKNLLDHNFLLGHEKEAAEEKLAQALQELADFRLSVIDYAQLKDETNRLAQQVTNTIYQAAKTQADERIENLRLKEAIVKISSEQSQFRAKSLLERDRLVSEINSLRATHSKLNEDLIASPCLIDELAKATKDFEKLSINHEQTTKDRDELKTKLETLNKYYSEEVSRSSLDRRLYEFYCTRLHSEREYIARRSRLSTELLHKERDAHSTAQAELYHLRIEMKKMPKLDQFDTEIYANEEGAAEEHKELAFPMLRNSELNEPLEEFEEINEGIELKQCGATQYNGISSSSSFNTTLKSIHCSFIKPKSASNKKYPIYTVIIGAALDSEALSFNELLQRIRNLFPGIAIDRPRYTDSVHFYLQRSAGVFKSRMTSRGPVYAIDENHVKLMRDEASFFERTNTVRQLYRSGSKLFFR